MLHIIRLMYEVFHAKSCLYQSDASNERIQKLDKERETRKDFKEKDILNDCFIIPFTNLGIFNLGYDAQLGY